MNDRKVPVPVPNAFKKLDEAEPPRRAAAPQGPEQAAKEGADNGGKHGPNGEIRFTIHKPLEISVSRRGNVA